MIQFPDKQSLIDSWETAIQDGTFVTDKHDPTKLGDCQEGYRTVISYEMFPVLGSFIKSGAYNVDVYKNTNPRFPGLSCIITPNDPSIILASGVPARSSIPISTCDRFNIVSGLQSGWHIFGVTSSYVQEQVDNGGLVLVNSF